MISPNAALFLILEADTKTSLSISCCVSLFIDFRKPKWCKVASTIITAPSTIKPKSIAPKLIKLALTPKTFIIPKANSIDNGIAEATIKPALKFPKKTTNTNTTITPVGNDWYRCTHTITNTSGQSSTDQVELVFVDNSNNRSNPTAGQTVYITGVQTEQLPFQTSFVDGVRNQPYVKIPIKLPTNYQINFYFRPSWSWSNPIQIPGTSEATYNILTYGLPGTSGFFLRYWIQTKKLDCFGATPQFNASQLNGYQMITIVKNNATCKVYVNGSVQLQKEGYTEPAPYYQYLLFGREGYTHQNGLFSNFFVGNQYGNNGQLIWTDDYVKKLYDSRSRFQGA